MSWNGVSEGGRDDVPGDAADRHRGRLPLDDGARGRGLGAPGSAGSTSGRPGRASWARVWAVLLFSALALGELVTDQLPATPSRKVPQQFGARMSPAPSPAPRSARPPARLAGRPGSRAAGAVAGTLGGAALRGRMAAAFGSDRPAALIEDALAIGLGLLAVGWHERRAVRRHRHRRGPGGASLAARLAGAGRPSR